MRTRLALAAAALSGMAVVVSILDDAQEALAFFVAAAIVALGQARLVSDASSAARRGAWFVAVVWILAGAWIGALLLMYQTASRAPPGPEATYLGLTATVYHLVALYGGMVLVTVAAWLRASGTAGRPPEGPRPSGGGTALRLMKLAGAVTLTGFAILLTAVVVETATGQSGMSPVDAYWVGRLPWTPIGVGMVVFGASAALLAGTAAAWLGSGWAARLLSVPALLAGALWWGVVSHGIYAGACCAPRAWDPVTAAYSDPGTAVLLLVLPALVLGLAVRPRRQVVELAGPGADQYRTVSGA